MSDYDEQNSKAYLSIDEKAYVRHVEAPGVLGLAAPRGKRLLDYGCGSGKYSRWAKQGGATEVLGVDVSAEQIALAQTQEEKEPLGVKFQVISADPGRIGEFDVVISVWVVIVAEDEATVSTFFRNAYENLCPGGTYLMWTSMVPHHKAGQERFIKAYDSDGIHFEIERELREPIKTELSIDNFKAPNYFFSAYTYFRLLNQAGFEDAKIISAHANPRDKRWDDFARDTGMCAVMATRPAKS